MKRLSMSALALLALLSGCALVDGPDAWTRRSDELAHNRQVWQSLAATSYRFTLTKLCECIPYFTGPSEITVEGGAIVGVRALHSGTTVPSEQWPAFETVETLFRKLDDAIQQRAYQYEATYDPGRGFPTWMWINPDARMADDEVEIRVDSLRVLQ